jgi:hydrogenase maturation protease
MDSPAFGVSSQVVGSKPVVSSRILPVKRAAPGPGEAGEPASSNLPGMKSPPGQGGAVRPRVLVLGIGNPLRSDDGAGLHVVRRLLREGLPAGVCASELTGGWTSLLDRLGACDRLIVVDAADVGLPPGSIVDLDPAAIRSGAKSSLAGGHFLDLREALALADTVGLPRPSVVRVLGIQAADTVSLSEECSPEVTAAIGAACARVRKLIEDDDRLPGAGP